MNHQTLLSHFLQDKKACVNWNYSFECNPSFSYISLFFNHIYIYIYFVSIISKQWIIWFFNFFGLSEILIFEFLSFFFSVSEISDKFCVSHCTFKQWLLHQTVIQIEIIQEQIMQWCSFLINLRFYKIILITLQIGRFSCIERVSN